MSRIAWLIALAGAAISLSSCNDPESYDSFFAAPRHDWVENARKLPTARVYDLYKKQVQMPGHQSSLAEVLGERGKESVDLMIADLENGNTDILRGAYGLLGSVMTRSNFNVCTYDAYYFKVNRALEKGFGVPFPRGTKYAGGTATTFDRMCQAGLRSQ